MNRLIILILSLSALAQHVVISAEATASPTQVEVEGRIERVVNVCLDFARRRCVEWCPTQGDVQSEDGLGATAFARLPAA